MSKIIPVIISSKLAETRAYYADLMEVGVTFDNHKNDLQVHSGPPDGPELPFANSIP